MKRSGDVKAKVMKEVGYKGGNKNAEKINPAYVSQIGTAVDPAAVEPFTRGTGNYGTDFGNKLAQNVGVGGPGKGRTVYPTGTQMQHGPANRGETNKAPDPPATQPGRDILSGFGPERSRG